MTTSPPIPACPISEVDVAIRNTLTNLVVLLGLALLLMGCRPSSDEITSTPAESVAPEAVSATPADGVSTSREKLPTVQDGFRPSLVLVTLDTTRADRLAAYGARGVGTPVLDRLAAEGVLFEHAVAVAPITLPSHASLFTGLYPPRHGVRNNSIHYLDTSLDTLAEQLRGQGWRTAAIVSAAVLDRRFGLDQGFDLYDDDLSQGGPRRSRLNAERPARVSVDSARSWLDGLPEDDPFFLWLHLFDPHAPYEPPAPWSERYRDRPYDGEIAVVDHEIGRLLEHPRIHPEKTMVMVIADHGESLGEHGEETHAMLVYEGTLRIPWLVRGPGVPAGRRVADPVSQVDLLPTALDLLGLEAVEGIDGRSLVSSMRAESPGLADASGRALYSETLVPYYTYGWSELRTVRGSGFKYIAAPEAEVYDLVADPAEQENLLGEHTTQVEALVEQLEGFDSAAIESSELARDPEMEARLRSLGYLSAGVADPDRERLDPKKVIGLHLAMERGQHLFFLRRFDAAESELRRVLAEDRDNLQALATLAKIRVTQNRLEDADRLARRSIELDPENPELHVVVGQVASGRGDLDTALAAFEAALALDPRWLDAAIHRVRCLDRLNRRGEAVEALEKVLERDADHARSQVAWAEIVELPEGKLEAAESRLRRITEDDPRLAEAWRVLGMVLEAGQRNEEAVEVYRRGLEAVPGEGTLHARLGALLARFGHHIEARGQLELALVGGQDTASVHYGLASLAIRDGDWRRVELHARRSTELDPGLSGAWNLFAASQEELARPSEALAAYDRAIGLDAENWRAHLNRGLLLAGLERFSEAVEDLEEVLKKRPLHAGAHFQLGLLYAGPLADPGRARQHLRHSLEAEPDHPRAVEIRRLLNLWPS